MIFSKVTSIHITKLVHGGVRVHCQENVSLMLEALKERAFNDGTVAFSTMGDGIDRFMGQITARLTQYWRNKFTVPCG